MFLNGFKVTIPQGAEKDGYVEMKHGVQYTINLGNRTNVDADAEVMVDGKSQGKFRVPKQGSISLERPVHDTGHFTCYKLDTPEGQSAQLTAGGNLGLITVTFKPARVVEQVYTPSYFQETLEADSPPLTDGGGMKGITRPAGTGLSGTSSQRFDTIASLDYDESKITTIHLRLVVADDDTPRPLTPVLSHETVIPAPVS